MIGVLVESALRASILAAIVAVVIFSLRIRNPRLQRSAWLVVLVAALAMPALMSVTSLAPPAVLSSAIQAIDFSGGAPLSTDADWHTSLLWMYMTIAGVLILRQIIGALRLWGIRNAAQRLPYFSEMSVDVRVSKVVASPVTAFSTVLVPADFGSWPLQKQSAVIAHESEHIANWDFFLQSLAHLYRGVFWFNPLAWWLPKRLSLLSEHMSDDAAIVAVEDRTAYVEILLGLASDKATAPAIAMASISTLTIRVQRILAETDVAGRCSSLRRYGLVAALLPLIGGVAGFQVSAHNTQSPPAASQKATPASAGRIVPPESNPALPLSHPIYPPPSRSRGEHGTVVLRLRVLENGSVGDAQVDQSSGYPSLDNAALYESYRWTLTPGTRNGKPEAMWGKFAVTFKLSPQ